MIIFILFYLTFIILDFVYIKKTGSKKDIKAYIFMSIVTLIFGVYFYSVEYKTSLVKNLFQIFNIDV